MARSKIMNSKEAKTALRDAKTEMRDAKKAVTDAQRAFLEEPADKELGSDYRGAVSEHIKAAKKVAKMEEKAKAVAA